MVSDQEFSQIMKGEKTGAKSDKPALKTEKLAEIEETKPRSALPPAKIESLAPPPRATRQEDPGLDEAKTPPSPPPRPVEEAVKPEPKPKPAKPVAAAAPQPPVQSPDASEPKPAPKPKAELKRAAVEAKPKPVEPPKKPEPKFKPEEVAKLLDQEKPKEQPPKPKPKSGDETADPTNKFDLSDISRIPQQRRAAAKSGDGTRASAGGLARRCDGERRKNVAFALEPARRFAARSIQALLELHWHWRPAEIYPANSRPLCAGRRVDRSARAFEPSLRSEFARSRRERSKGRPSVQSAAHPDAISTVLRSMEGPDRSL